MAVSSKAQRSEEYAINSICCWFIIFVLCMIGLLRIPIPDREDLEMVFLLVVLLCSLTVSGWLFISELIDIFRPVGPQSKGEDRPAQHQQRNSRAR